MAADSDYVTIPFRHEMNIPEKSSQEFWDYWNPAWGKIKRETDDIRASLATDKRPDKLNPYYGLTLLTKDHRNQIASKRVESSCNNLVRSNGQWINMKSGTIFPINSNGCQLQSNAKKTSLKTVKGRTAKSFIDLLSSLPEDIYRHICYAGGSVKNIILDLKNNLSTDHDLFIVGECEPRAIAKKLFEFWANKIDVTIKYVARTKWAITVYMFHNETNYKVQIILRHYVSPSEVIFGFDIDASACLYHLGEFYATPGAIHSFQNMELYIDVDRLSSTGISRYLKYWKQNGFVLRIPMSWPDAYLDPFLRSRYNKCSGQYEVLQSTDDNCLYSLFYRAYRLSCDRWSGSFETVDYEETKKSITEFNTTKNEMYNKWSKDVCGVNVLTRNPNIYILIGNRKYYSEMIDYLFSMPKPMFDLARLMSVPTETDFVSVNPGKQGDVGLVEINGRVMLTGSFHPVNKTWKSWSELPQMKITNKRNVTMSQIQAAEDPNIGYQYMNWASDGNSKRSEIISTLIDMIGSRTREKIQQLLKNNEMWSTIYISCLQNLKECENQEINLKKINYYSKTISRKEDVFLGQRHFIDDYHGIGYVISINVTGVLFYIEKCICIRGDENYCDIHNNGGIANNGSITEYIRYLHIDFHDEDDDSDAKPIKAVGPESEVQA